MAKKQSSLQNLFKISFASILIITFFYILPTGYNYTAKIFKSNPEVENTSNLKLAEIMDGKILNDSEDENNFTEQDLVYQELYGEVTEEDSLETGVRLKASVLYQLFEDTNYKLNDVRQNKIAKPVEIGKLPYELKEIQNVKKERTIYSNSFAFNIRRKQ